MWDTKPPVLVAPGLTTRSKNATSVMSTRGGFTLEINKLENKTKKNKPKKHKQNKEQPRKQKQKQQNATKKAPAKHRGAG